MVYLCSHCDRVWATPQALIDHLRISHTGRAIVPDYGCLQGACHGRVFNCLTQFKRHLLRDHLDDAAGVFEPEVEIHVENEDGNNDNDNNNEVQINPIIQPEQEVTVPQLMNSIFTASLMYVSKLHAHDALPRSVVQDVVTFNQDFSSSGFIDILKHRVTMLFQRLHELDPADNVDNDILEINQMFEILKRPFEGLETEIQRFNAFRANNTLIEPEQFIMGIRVLSVHVNGHPVLQPVPARIQFIPMRYVLKAFLALPNVFASILTFYRELMREVNIISNFVQGTLWRELSAAFHRDGKIVFPLFLSFD